MHTSIERKYGEKRREERVSLIGTVYCTNTINSDVFPGITVNVSDSGASIYTPYPLDEGVRITMRGDKLRCGLKSATVKWVSRIGTDIYKIGLSFS